MRRHHRNSVPALDPAMVERLLDGAAHQDDVPRDYRDVARVLAAAAAPAAPRPSAEAAALATFRSTRRPVDPPRRTSVFSKLLGAKAVAAVVLGTATVGTAAAAAAGALPDQAQAKAHSIVAAVPDADRSDHGTGAAEDAGARAGGAGAAATLPGAAGLCQAYGSGSGGENGQRLDSAAFGRLADAAGGADKISAYCGTVAAAAAARPAPRRAGTAGGWPARAGVGWSPTRRAGCRPRPWSTGSPPPRAARTRSARTARRWSARTRAARPAIRRPLPTRPRRPLPGRPRTAASRPNRRPTDTRAALRPTQPRRRTGTERALRCRPGLRARAVPQPPVVPGPRAAGGLDRADPDPPEPARSGRRAAGHSVRCATRR